MSFLAPLYALGLLTIAGPILFHLIRRTPRGEFPFSSLMFLAPTPPRLTRRSRLENLLLLMLRGLALTLLAMAFARPFLREESLLDSGEVAQQRVAVLIDTSASMRRADLWARARSLAEGAVAACRPADEVAVFTFDATSRPLLGFEESRTLDPPRRRDTARSRLASAQPSWSATDLGQALVETAAMLEAAAGEGGVEKGRPLGRRIVLVGDLQQGSRLEALGQFEWPADLELELKPVEADGSNAGLSRQAESEAEAEPAASPGGEIRVRVANDAGSRKEEFTLDWMDGRGAESGAPMSVYVPPGESRAVRVPLPRPTGGPAPKSLRLRGDDHGFDNALYVADETRAEETIVFLGPDRADDPAGLLYYLDRVFPETPRRKVLIRALGPTPELAREPLDDAPLVVMAGQAQSRPNGLAERLRRYMTDGGTLLYVATKPGRDATLAVLAGQTGEAPNLEERADPKGILLGTIAFDHPLFAPMAGPQFNDFTKIHFWKYRHLDPAALGESRILASFEDGGPAIVEKCVGRGRLVYLASGWAPTDSQLARSSKFLPLMASLLEGPDATRFAATGHLINEPVPLPSRGPGSRADLVQKPDGSRVAVPAGSRTFDATDVPGVYTLQSPAGPRSFAVNLDPQESKTAVLSPETLEQYGCRLASRGAREDESRRTRQLRNIELEGRQKLWRWLILAALIALVIETWIAGTTRTPRSAPAEVIAR